MLGTSSPLVIGVVGILRSRSRQTYGYFEEILQGVVAQAGNVDADVHIYRDDSWLWQGSASAYASVCHGLLLFAGACRQESIQTITTSGLPLLTVGDSIIASPHSSLDVDNYGSGKAATEHLIKLGHRRIGILTGRLTNDGWARLRYAGYVDAMRQAGLDIDESIVVDVTHPSFDPGYEGTCSMLQAAEPPTAIVALSDETAFGAITRVLEVGLRVPQDISVVGFDDVKSAADFNPPLTTVRQPTQLIGAKAVDLLAKHIANRHLEPVHVTVPAEIVVRASTAPRSMGNVARAA